MAPRIARRARALLLALLVLPAAAPPARAQAPPGAPAPKSAARELRQALAAATARFEALDPAGVLAHVSDQYRNGPITKASLREHLLAMFALYDTVRARIRVDEVRMVDGAAWVYSTGAISGRLRGVGAWTTVMSWEREPEVARREGAAWRLVGPSP